VIKGNYEIRQKKKAVQFIHLLYFIGLLSKEEMAELMGIQINQTNDSILSQKNLLPNNHDLFHKKYFP
jgi:transcription initiation factor IIE alpha subunit